MSERWITQTLLHTEEGPPGNCVQAAVASLLALELDAVPHFVAEHGTRWQLAFMEWLKGRGIELHRLDRTYHPDGLYLAIGPSPRGISHMVVMRGGELLHDPHPSRQGLREVERVWLLAPADIGTWWSPQARAYAPELG